MSDPTSAGLAGVSLVASMLGGATQASSIKEQAAAQAAMYNYQAGVAIRNQQLERQNAGTALMQGEEQAAQSGMATRARLGQIRAAQGASGLRIGEGTMPLVPESQRRIGSMEQTTIGSNAAKAAYDYDVSAWKYGTQAGLYSMAAMNTKAAAPLAEEASILGSAASVSDKWLQFSQAGNFGNLGKTLSGMGSNVAGALGLG